MQLTRLLYPANKSVKIFTSQDAKLYKELPIQNAVELNFSPLGTFLSTWERLGQFVFPLPLPVPDALCPVVHVLIYITVQLSWRTGLSIRT